MLKSKTALEHFVVYDPGQVHTHRPRKNTKFWNSMMIEEIRCADCDKLLDRKYIAINAEMEDMSLILPT